MRGGSFFFLNLVLCFYWGFIIGRSCHHKVWAEEAAFRDLWNYYLHKFQWVFTTSLTDSLCLVPIHPELQKGRVESSDSLLVVLRWESFRSVWHVLFYLYLVLSYSIFWNKVLLCISWLSWNSLWNTWWLQTCSNPPAQRPESWTCVPPYLAILELCYYKLWEMILPGPELSIQTHFS